MREEEIGEGSELTGTKDDWYEDRNKGDCSGR